MRRLLLAILALALAGCSDEEGASEPGPNPSVGQVDPTYASGGSYRVTVPKYAGITSSWRVAVANSGNAFITGQAITKLDGTGIPDPTYNVQLPSSSPLLDEAGNLYVRTAAGIAKLDSGGRPVAGFGTDGVALAPWLLAGSGAFVRDRSENLVLVGPAVGTSGLAFQSIAAKFDRDGRLVATFGNAGTLALSLPNAGISYTDAVAVDAQGNVYIGGLATALAPAPAFVMKLDSDGRLVTAFGTGGSWFAPPICSEVAPPAIAFAASGHAYVACEQAIFKLDAVGALDQSWGLMGASTPLGNEGPSGAGRVTSLVVAPNGEVFAAGLSAAASFCTDFIVARLTTAGAPVSSFGVDGRLVVSVEARDERANIAMDEAGRLYVSGVSIPGCTIMRPIAQSTHSVTRIR